MDRNIFKKFIHVKSGQEFDIGYLRKSNYIETMALDGPKLIMEWDDPSGYIKDNLNLKELDEIEAHLSDDWALDGLNVVQKVYSIDAERRRPKSQIEHNFAANL